MNLYVIIFALAAVIGAYFYGHGQGEESANAEWLKRENTELTDANAKIIELNKVNRAIEQEAARAVNEVSKRYQKEITNVSNQKDRVIADLRSGAIRLRNTACQEAGRDTRPAATPDTSGTPTSSGSQFSEQDAEFFIREASRADEHTLALNSCIAILQSDRAAINR